jgi:hypothetical protein
MTSVVKQISLLTAFIFIAVIVNAQVTDSISVKDFKITQTKTRQQIEWSTDAERPSSYWRVQASKDGKTFTTIGLVLGADPRQEGYKYIFIQPIQESKSKRFYRLSHVDKDGTERLTNVVRSKNSF